MHQDETPSCLPNTQVRGLQVHPRFCPSHSCPISNWSSSLGEFTFLILPESFHCFCFLHCNSFTPDSPHLLCANTIACYDCLLSVPSPPVHSGLRPSDLSAKRPPFSQKQSWISPFTHALWTCRKLLYSYGRTYNILLRTTARAKETGHSISLLYPRSFPDTRPTVPADRAVGRVTLDHCFWLKLLIRANNCLRLDQ